MSLKAETEMAMKLLEKDIHEKQDTIVSLRRQLDDIKAINLDMYRKLQVGAFISSGGYLNGVEFVDTIKVLSFSDKCVNLVLSRNYSNNFRI